MYWWCLAGGIKEPRGHLVKGAAESQETAGGSGWPPRQAPEAPCALSVDARYQINARTELAVRYNDISPLENHHCAVAFQILAQPECNIFANVQPDGFKQIRQVCRGKGPLTAQRGAMSTPRGRALLSRD